VILYIAATAACLFVLAGDVVLINPHLSAILRDASILFDQSKPNLLWSNVYLGVSFIAAIVAVLALVQIWLPRYASPSVRHVAVSRVIIAAGAIYICCCLAILTYFPGLNFVFGLHRPDLNWPGVYTAFAVILAGFFALSIYRQRQA
jgi:hypothetical protein